MTKRIYQSTFAVVFITLLLCVVLISGSLYGQFEERMYQMLEQSSVYMEQAIENEGIEYLESLAGGGNRVTLIQADGKVIYDNYVDAVAMDNHSDREEFIAALATGEGRSTRHSFTLGKETLYYAIQLENGMVLRLSTIQRNVGFWVLDMVKLIAGIALVVLSLAAFFSAKLSKMIMKPINSINPEHPEDSDTYEELTPLLTRLHQQNKMIKENMETLCQKQSEFETITGHMSEGFLVLNLHKKILSYNQSALELMAVEKLTDDKAVFALNRSEGFRKAVDLAVGGSKSTEIINVNGRSLQIIANAVKQEDSVAGAVVVIMDVTEQVEWETLRREFTANVSHELKTPLTSISGIAEIIKNGIVKDEDISHFAENIYKEAERMIHLINDIIKLSQLDEGAIPSQRENIDLYDLAENVCFQLKEAAAAKQLSIEITGGHETISGVPQIVQEMLYNLVDNAIKYNNEHGSVHVDIRATSEVTLSSVSDTGIGIADKDIDRVFERFYRADKSHSKSIGGTGLGLSIVKHGAAFHDAKVEISSKIDKGTTITIEWPKVI